MTARDEWYLAPLLGVTDLAFRTVYHQYFPFFDGSVTPFLSVREEAPRVRRSYLYRHFSPGERVPAAVQILNADTQGFVALAEGAAAAGASEVNWNIACPAPVVTRRGRGAALLEEPDRIDRFLDSVMPSLKVDLSLKMRLPRQYNEKSLRRLGDLLDGYPLSRVILHPRTADQGYTGTPSLSACHSLKNNLKVPLLYSGDIVDESTFIRARSQLGPGGWLLGRGAVADPFLAAELRGIKKSDAEKLETFWHFIYALEHRLSGPGREKTKGLARFKGLWGFWSHSLPGGEDFYRRLVQTGNWEEANGLMHSFRENTKSWMGLTEDISWAL